MALPFFPGGSDGKASAFSVEDPGSIPGKIPWRRKWRPTPVLLPGKFHGLRSLVGYSPQESDMTSLSLSLFFGTGMKTDFSSPVATAEFSKFADVLSAAL